MNPIERAVRVLDDWQQRHRPTAFIYAVIRKFGDDQAGNQVALISYFAFVSLFPLLLALFGILGFVLHGDPRLQQRLETSALADFPIIGQQLHSQLGLARLHHSGPALVIGVVGAALGGRGLANAVQNAMNTVWNVPRQNRPGFPWNWLRTFGLLGLMGVGAALTAAASSIAAAGHSFGVDGFAANALAFVVGASLEALLFLGAFRLATARVVATRDLAWAAVWSGIAWQILLSVAGVIISHDLRHAQAVAGFFGIVLGLLAWVGLQATVTIYAVEADVVRTRHLWPRSIMQPPLTPADKTYLTAAVHSEIRRPEQQVSVEFSADADRRPT